MEGFSQILRSLGGGRLMVLLLAVGALIGFLIYIIGSAGTGDLSTLYTGLDPSEGGRIVARLEGMNVPYKIEENGAQILVPKTEIGRIRMVLAESGLPSGGLIGYEIFDKSDSFSATSFSQDLNHLRALEGELARSIKTLAYVGAARVHLVLPRRELFSRQVQEPSASVVLRMSGPVRLSNQQVEAIRHLVGAAVPGLDPKRVAVIDNKGLLLAKSTEKEESLSSTNTEEMRVAYEERLARMLDQLLEKSVGIGKARTQITVDMDFDHITENAEIYNPDGQVIRSTQTAQEGANSSEHGQQAVTVETNLPKSNDSSSGNRSQSNRQEETINYEISKTIKTHIKEIGNVKKLSVAVVIDGNYTTDPKTKEKKYTPRTQQELDQYTKLIKSAVGYNKERGDLVEVINLPFVEAEIEEATNKTVFGFEPMHILKIVQFIVIIIVGMVVVMLVIRPLIIQLLELSRQRISMVQETIQKQTAEANEAATQAELVAANAEVERKFNLGRIDGLVRASSLTKISDIIEQFPEQTVSMIRSWLSEGASPKDFNDQ